MTAKEKAPLTSAKASGADEAGTVNSASNPILSQPKGKVNPLRNIRVDNDIPAADIVAEVQTIYPKFDKPLLSKCEHGDEYGVCLRRDAMELIVGKYAAEQTVRIENRKLKNRISCRLSDEDYEALVTLQNDNGYTTMQNFLTYIIRCFIKEVNI